MSEIYRLVQSNQPVTDEVKARQAFGYFQNKNNNSGYFYAQKLSNSGQPYIGDDRVVNCFIVTGGYKQRFIKDAASIMKLHLKGIFSKKNKKKAAQAEQDLWANVLKASTDLDIDTL